MFEVGRFLPFGFRRAGLLTQSLTHLSGNDFRLPPVRVKKNETAEAHEKLIQASRHSPPYNHSGTFRHGRQLAGLARTGWHRRLFRKKSPAKMEYERERALEGGFAGSWEFFSHRLGQPRVCRPGCAEGESTDAHVLRPREWQAALSIGCNLRGERADPGEQSVLRWH